MWCTSPQFGVVLVRPNQLIELATPRATSNAPAIRAQVNSSQLTPRAETTSHWRCHAKPSADRFATVTTTDVERRHTLCWGTLRHLTLTELIGVADRTGFAAVTASVVQHGSEIRERASYLTDLCRTAGVRVECVEPVISPLPGLRERNTVAEQLRVFLDHDADDVIECAVLLEAQSVNIAHFLGTPHDLEDLSLSVSTIAANAGQHGLITTVEFIPGTGIASLNDVVQVIATSPQPNLRVLIDAWHLSKAGLSPNDLERVPPGLIHAVQLCDTSDSPSNNTSVFSHRQLPGQGSLLLQDIVGVALRNNPMVDLQVEVFNDDLPRMLAPDAIATAARASLDELV